MSTERLQKLLARAGHGSRRSCESLLRDGRVTVNGRPARLGDKADPERDAIAVDGRPLTLAAPTYIMLHKPRGVITSLEDELGRDRQTVRDLVDLPGHLYPVGRLDKQSEGLILMTNDGELAHRLTHPRYGHKKRYRVLISGFADDRRLEKWRNGIVLDERMTAPVAIQVLSRQTDHTWLQIDMREGRKRQIRRVAALLDFEVRRLLREKIGPLALGDLAPGAWRHLTPSEIASLRSATQRAGQKRRSRPRKARQEKGER